jgi:hypothetical protein
MQAPALHAAFGLTATNDIFPNLCLVSSGGTGDHRQPRRRPRFWAPGATVTATDAGPRVPRGGGPQGRPG